MLFRSKSSRGWFKGFPYAHPDPTLPAVIFNHQLDVFKNPARQAALNGGLADHVAALTINKVCGSGLKAVMIADQAIRVGDIDIAVAGGMESMSNCPYLLTRVREGLRIGNTEVIDSMINDGLWCAFEQCHMGHSGEVVAEHFKAEIDKWSKVAREANIKLD